jgi:hypothetical protein
MSARSKLLFQARGDDFKSYPNCLLSFPSERGS